MKTIGWMSGLGVGVMLAGLGCASHAGGDGELVGSSESGTSADALSSDVAIGSTLATTGNLNLRSGPSTSDGILHVMPKGAQVTTINVTTPSNGFYNVTHLGVDGWASGKFLTLVQSGGGGGDDAGGGGGTPSGPRGDAVARASDGVGFSYWWGHGRFVPGGPSSSNAGSCSGSCPSCSHSGSYGADCSGYLGKVWQVPSDNTDETADSHPYSSYNFYYESHGWHDVARSDVQQGDALTHNSGGSGHIFVYDSGDGWGSMWAYEARGCATGIVHDLRTASSAYKAIAHDGW